MHVVSSVELGKQLTEADTAVATARSIWQEDQASTIATFLDEEARLTVETQHARTEEIADELPALKTRLEAARDASVVRFFEWAKQNESNVAALRQVFQTQSANFVEPWVDVMLAVGYLGGGSSVQMSGRGGFTHRSWGFYYPATGSARSTWLPATNSLVALEAAVSHLAEIAHRLDVATKSEQKERAAKLWAES